MFQIRRHGHVRLENGKLKHADRTGDLLITKPYVSSLFCSYFSHSWRVLRVSGDASRLLTTRKTHETQPRADKTADKQLAWRAPGFGTQVMRLCVDKTVRCLLISNSLPFEDGDLLSKGLIPPGQCRSDCGRRRG